MPSNIHSLAKHIRKLYLEKVQADLTDAGFKVRFREGMPKTTTEVGIHVRTPTEVDLLEAAEKAERDGFDIVFIYPN